MLKHKIIFLFLVAIATNMAAQVPGYKGKRMLISANIAPSLISPILGDEGSYGSPLNYRIRPRFGGSFDYVVNRRSTLGLRYTFLNIGNLAYSYYDGSTSGVAPISVGLHSINLRWTRYRSGNLPAPLGVYYGWNLGLGISSLVDKEGKLLDPYGEKKKGVYVNGIHPDVIGFIGIRRGIGSRVMWSISAELNLAYVGYLLSFVSDGKDASEIDGTSEDGKWTYLDNKFIARSAYYSSNTFNITLEFTFLPK